VFRRDLPIGLTPAGKETIRVVNLTREDLLLRRAAHLKVVETYCAALGLLNGDARPGAVATAERMRAQLNEFKETTAEFSACVQDFLSSQGWA
jgi:hypothetical protein